MEVRGAPEAPPALGVPGAAGAADDEPPAPPSATRSASALASTADFSRRSMNGLQSFLSSSDARAPADRWRSVASLDADVTLLALCVLWLNLAAISTLVGMQSRRARLELTRTYRRMLYSLQPLELPIVAMEDVAHTLVQLGCAAYCGRVLAERCELIAPHAHPLDFASADGIALHTALGLGSLCSGIVENLGFSDVAKLIFRALERGEPLNWRHVCAVIRVACVTCPSASEKWLDLLRPLISESLQEENSRRLIMGLLLVRHVTFTVTTPGTCPSYLTWLNNNVDGETGILSGNVKLSCQFLVTILTKLVPRDPVPVLKAQLSARMSVLVKQSREARE